MEKSNSSDVIFKTAEIVEKIAEIMAIISDIEKSIHQSSNH